MKKVFLLFAISVTMLAISCQKDSTSPNTEGAYFPEVKTIIQQNCITCHYAGGQGMPVILTEDSDIVNDAAAIKAATIDPVTPFNKRMPLGGELSDADKAIIENWFNAGGKQTD